MFEALTKKVTKAAVTEAKETIKEEATNKTEELIPKVVPFIFLTIGALILLEPGKSKSNTVYNITNNYYIYRR